MIDEYASLAKEVTEPQHAWPDLWRLSKAIHIGFRAVRFGSGHERRRQWERFHVAETDSRELRQGLEWHSANARDIHLRYLDDIPLANDLQDLFDPGAYVGSDQAYFARQREKLRDASRLIGEAKDRLRQDGIMVPRDRKVVGDRVYAMSQALNGAWAAFKEEERTRYCDRISGRLSQLREVLSRRYEVLARVEANRAANEAKLDGSEREAYRERVSGWIDEGRERIASLKESIEDIRNLAGSADRERLTNR